MDGNILELKINKDKSKILSSLEFNDLMESDNYY